MDPSRCILFAVVVVDGIGHAAPYYVETGKMLLHADQLVFGKAFYHPTAALVYFLLSHTTEPIQT